MNRNAKLILNQVDSLRNTLRGSDFILSQWQRSTENAIRTGEITPLIVSLQRSTAGLQRDMMAMHRHLARIEEILTAND